MAGGEEYLMTLNGVLKIEKETPEQKEFKSWLEKRRGDIYPFP